MNMSGNLGAELFPIAVARLVTVSGNWDYVLFLFAAVYATAGIFWLLLNPVGTVFGRSEFD